MVSAEVGLALCSLRSFMNYEIIKLVVLHRVRRLIVFSLCVHTNKTNQKVGRERKSKKHSA